MAEPIPAEYVERAARAYYDAAAVHWDTLASSDQDAAKHCLRAALESFVKDAIPDLIPVAVEMVRKEMREGSLLSVPRNLLEDFVDPDECRYDHHGYCQAHGWLDDDPACPHARAKRLLAGES